MKHNIFANKEFLNKDFSESDASIHSVITIEEDDTNGDVWDYSELKIRDCTRSINLSISLREDKLENSLYKVDTLINHLTKLRIGMLEGAEILKELKNNEIKTNIVH